MTIHNLQANRAHKQTDETCGTRYRGQMLDWSAIINSVVSFALGVAGTLIGLWIKRERIQIRSEFSGGQLYISVFNPTKHVVNVERLQFEVRHKGSERWEEISQTELTEYWPKMQIPPRDKIDVPLGSYACISHGMAEESRFTVTLVSGKRYVYACRKGSASLSG